MEKVDFLNSVHHSNYITTAPKKNNSAAVQSSYATKSLPFTASVPILSTRTELSSTEEKKKYAHVLKLVDKPTRKQLEMLLKSGVLLNADSNDKSTVLDNLFKMGTTPRAVGLSKENLLKDTISTIANPYIITQQFGDIPKTYRQGAVEANRKDVNEYGLPKYADNEIDVEHSGTCPAASIEFSLASKNPAEFARFAEGLSSPRLSVNKNIKLRNLADNTLDAIWLLNAFEVPFKADNFNEANLTFAPDKSAILRAQIQTTNRDHLERSPLDVLMQSTFMQVGSQQSYNSLTDKRAGKFNRNDKGLVEFEKTFTESVVEDKSTLSVVYQTVDENARLVGYETDFNTIKRQLTEAIDMGEHVILGYTYVDQNNIIIGGHEITLVGYKEGADGKLTFICNDTDDNIPRAIEYSEDYLLPKIHHAGLPEQIAARDMKYTPAWVEGLEMYKQMRNAA